LFDAQLHLFGKLHSGLLGLTLGSPQHFAFAAAFDLASGAACAAVLWLLLHAGASLVGLLGLEPAAAPAPATATAKTKAKQI
jgi:hypothetical protein